MSEEGRFEIPKEMRSMAEASFDQARQAFEKFLAGAQATYILDKILASISALGGRAEDVVRTRIYLRDPDRWEPVSRAHGRVFGAIMPANTMIAAGGLIGDYEVEIEAEAVVAD